MTTATATAGVLTPYTIPADGGLCLINAHPVPAGVVAFLDGEGWIVCAGCAAHCTSCTDPDCDHPLYAGPDEMDAATQPAPAHRPDCGLISDSAARRDGMRRRRRGLAGPHVAPAARGLAGRAGHPPLRRRRVRRLKTSGRPRCSCTAAGLEPLPRITERGT